MVELLARLPEGTVELTTTRWRAAEGDGERIGLTPPSRDLDAGALAERTADELTAAVRLEDWPSPTLPRPVAGGWIHDEVVDDDRPAFESVLACRAGEGAEAIALACQELRFPVTPYRPLPAPTTAFAAAEDRQAPAPDAAGPPPRPRAIRVVDLSTHWAGPLATMLLAEAGAQVVKIDPDCRPDGFRTRGPLYRHLNHRKEIVDLDLRRGADRARFEALLADADLLVESFSRRVLGNLGYGPDDLARLNPRLAVVSIKAFPARSAEADWLAYGPGVHAASGLGLVTGRPLPAPVAYPDVVAGVTGYARAVGLLADRSVNDQPPARAEVALARSIEPLVLAAAREGNRPPDLGR